jgi:hypothetical protein
LKLPKTQVALLAKMASGESLHYMGYMGRFNSVPYYLCGVLHRCTAAANALIEKGLIVRHQQGFANQTFTLSDEGRAIAEGELSNGKSGK